MFIKKLMKHIFKYEIEKIEINVNDFRHLDMRQ